jgi:hypothetical protein
MRLKCTRCFPQLLGLLAPYQRWIGRGAAFLALLGLAILALAFAHAWAPSEPDHSSRCFETFFAAQWPKWLGCAMAQHENLAGGLVRVWAALSAAWLAYSSLREQIEEDRRKVERQIERDHQETRRRQEEAAITALVANSRFKRPE